MKRASSVQCQAHQLTLLSKDCLQCEARMCHEIQSWYLKNEGEKFFPSFAQNDQRYAPLCAAFGSVQFLCPGNFSILATPLLPTPCSLEPIWRVSFNLLKCGLCLVKQPTKTNMNPTLLCGMYHGKNKFNCTVDTQFADKWRDNDQFMW